MPWLHLLQPQWMRFCPLTQIYVAGLPTAIFPSPYIRRRRSRHVTASVMSFVDVGVCQSLSSRR